MADENEMNGQSEGSRSSSGTPEGFVEKSRLDNALRKIEQLTLTNKALTDELTQIKGENGTLSAKLLSKEAEFTSALEASKSEASSNRTAKEELALQIDQMKQASETQNRKLKAIREIGRPELVSIIDLLPSASTDEEQIKALKGIADFASAQVKSREKELTTGTTHTEVTPQGAELPTTDDGWSKYVEGFSLGSEQRQKANDAWFDYLKSKK